MTIRIGWSKDRKPGQVAGGVWLFEYLRIRDEDGRGRHLVIGFLSYRREDLERFAEKERVLDVRVIGVLRFAKDVTPALVQAVVRRIDVTGPIIASPAVSDAVSAMKARETGADELRPP